MHKFNDDWTYRLAEYLVAFYFKNQGYKVFKADKFLNYDMRIEKDSNIRYIEVKLDKKAFYTGNLFWETEVDGDLGWTQHELELPVEVFWVFPGYFLTLPHSFISKFDFEKYNKKRVLNKSSRKEGYYISYGYLVPIKELPIQKIKYADANFS